MTGSLTIKNGKYYAVLNTYEDGTEGKRYLWDSRRYRDIR